MKALNTLGFVAATSLAAGFAFADLPAVKDMNVVQKGRTLKVTYKLTSAPAVVTMDVQTNSPSGWASIGGENIQSFTPESAVFRIVDTKDATDDIYSIKWRPDLSWPGHKIAANDIRVVLTAWATNATPDYMVVDITKTALPNSQKYYPSVEFLPGGLLKNDDYRTNKLVLRRIHAKDVTWTMGSVNEAGRGAPSTADETAHTVTLPNDYYMGVFEVTQSQWVLLSLGNPINPSKFAEEATKAMRPVDSVSFSEVRLNKTSTAVPASYWPAKPNQYSFLGQLRSRTGLLFDLPSEAQWEFACRAGNGEGKWNDGSAYTDATTDQNLPGRYAKNGGLIDGSTEPAKNCSTNNATMIVGSSAPNSWGLYDMHGNVKEWCQDWWQINISTLGGAVNIDPKDGSKLIDGSTSGSRIARGGCYGDVSADCRSAARSKGSEGYGNYQIGFRVMCGGLE